MPAFIAHFLIARGVFASSGLPDNEQNRRYFLLGSVGPDLPYYRNVFASALGTFFEEKFNPDSPGVYAGYGDCFHARTTNIFPMKMLEILRKDKDPTTADRKTAYALGYLTHVAADQHIHPFVEEYAGPYYVSADNRKKHRTLEVYEDILLYEKRTGKKFFEEDFSPWFDVSTRETVEIPTAYGGPRTEERLVSFLPDWLKSFVQRAFLEAYGIIIETGEIEKWGKGFTSVFSALGFIGPYHDASDSIRGTSAEAQGFAGIFDGEDYVGKCFEPAAQLATRYMAAASRFLESDQISEQVRGEFLGVVSDADLTSPLVTL